MAHLEHGNSWLDFGGFLAKSIKFIIVIVFGYCMCITFHRFVSGLVREFSIWSTILAQRYHCSFALDHLQLAVYFTL